MLPWVAQITTSQDGGKRVDPDCNIHIYHHMQDAPWNFGCFGWWNPGWWNPGCLGKLSSKIIFLFRKWNMFPKCSMHGMFPYTWHEFMANVSNCSIHGASRLVSWMDHVTTMGNEMPRFCGFCCHKNRRVGNGKGKLFDNSRWQGAEGWTLSYYVVSVCFQQWCISCIRLFIQSLHGERWLTVNDNIFQWLFIHVETLDASAKWPHHPDMCDTTKILQLQVFTFDHHYFPFNASNSSPVATGRYQCQE